MDSRFLLPAVALALVCACGTAPAAVLYSTFGPGDAFDGMLVQWIGYGAAAGQTFVDRQVANRFTVAGDSEVTGYRVAVSHFSGPAPHGDGAGRLSLWSGGSAPATMIEAAIDFNIGDGTAIIASVPSVFHPLLVPGTAYWLVLSAPDGELYRWYFSNLSAAAGWEIQFRQGSGSWNSAGQSANAFEVQGVVGGVPEPATWLLLGSAAALGAIARARRPLKQP